MMDAYANSNTPEAARDKRATPGWLIDQMCITLHINSFDFDICAEKHTAKAKNFFTAENDSLSFEWDSKIPQRAFVWMNPPYSDIGPWLERASYYARRGQFFVLACVPDDRGTQWYQNWIENVASVAWLPPHRISFLDGDGVPQNGNPKPSILPLYTPWRTFRTEYVRLPHWDPDA